MVCQSEPLTRDTRTLQAPEYTSARRVEAHAGRAEVSWSLGAVKDANLPTFGVEDLYGREPFHHTHRPVATGALPDCRLARRSRGCLLRHLSE